MSESDHVPNGFRQIPDFPRYAIDENGTVLSICHVNGRGKDSRWESAKILKPVPDTDGYQRAFISHKGHRKSVSIHTLVLTIFVGPCPDGMQCRHLDGNQNNNHVSNLAWGTKSQNELDKLLHGTFRGKLTKKDVLAIRARAARGERNTDIAKDFRVHVGNVSRIVQRKAWKHILLLLSCLALTGCQQLASATATSKKLPPRATSPSSIRLPDSLEPAPIAKTLQIVRMKRKPFQGAKAYVIDKRANEWRLSIAGGATEGWFSFDDFASGGGTNGN